MTSWWFWLILETCVSIHLEVIYVELDFIVATVTNTTAEPNNQYGN